MPITIFIADDHVILREGVAAILSKRAEFEVVGDAKDGQAALEGICALKPDIALLDVNMPKMDGVAVAQIIRTRCPETKCLILTMYTEDQRFFDALQAGVAGYVVKGAGSRELIDAIKIVYAGEMYISPSMTRKLVAHHLQNNQTAPPRHLQQLTNRELEVMHLLAKGMTNREIAAQLFISPNTVQTHRSHIMEKLELNNRADLIRYAVQHNLLER